MNDLAPLISIALAINAALLAYVIRTESRLSKLETRLCSILDTLRQLGSHLNIPEAARRYADMSELGDISRDKRDARHGET